MTTITLRSFIDDGARYYEVTYRFDGQVYKREWFPFLRSALRDIEGIKYCRADMEREPGVYEYELEAAPGLDIRRPLFDIVSEHHWYLLSLQSTELTLEDVFLKITMGEGVVIPSQQKNGGE